MKNSKDFSYIWSCFRLKILGTSTIQRFYVPEESRIFHCLLSSPLILAFFFKYDQIARLNLFGCRAAFRQRACRAPFKATHRASLLPSWRVYRRQYQASQGDQTTRYSTGWNSRRGDHENGLFTMNDHAPMWLIAGRFSRSSPWWTNRDTKTG